MTSQDIDTARADLVSLNRVFHRLAVVDTTDRLSIVLDKLLPRLLKRIGDNNQRRLECQSNLKPILDQIHAKLVEMLSHIVKRVREDKACRLNCQAILDLLVVDDTKEDGDLRLETIKSVDPFTLNLSLTFLAMGVPRSDDVSGLMPGLCALIGAAASLETLQSQTRRSQSHQLAHLFLKCVERVVSDATTKPGLSSSAPSNDANCKTVRALLQKDEAAAEAIFDLLLDTLLYQPSKGSLPPPGLGQEGHERLRSNSAWATEMTQSTRLAQLKLTVLEIIAPSRAWNLFGSDNPLSISRMVTLLLVATGDTAGQVSERASTLLKLHVESVRGSAGDILGDHIGLSCGLMTLCLGQTAAESALMGVANHTLGWTIPATQPSSQTVLSTKRRPVSEGTQAVIMTFLASKVLDDNPHLLDELSSDVVCAVGSLIVKAASKTLESLLTNSGLSTLRAKPYVAAAQLLNAWAVRWTTFYDTHAEPGLASLLGRGMDTACYVLAPAASHGTSNTNLPGEGSLAIRDACYGIICTLCRSKLALADDSSLFARGKPMAQASAPPVETALLLFNCAAREQERLRPRAVAALDALLGAYVRLLPATKSTEVATNGSNPWATAPTTAPAVRPGLDTAALSRALSGLVWTAASSHQPKASRVAAATWASQLLVLLDKSNACHVLCWCAGDSDTTVRSIARQCLESASLNDFGSWVNRVFGASRWHTFDDFPHRGKAAALTFGLDCLLNDLYGGEDDAVETYLKAVTGTLSQIDGTSRSMVELLDEASQCLLSTLSSSQFARRQVAQGNMSLRLRDIEDLALAVSSSVSRRHLSGACGCLYEDVGLWTDSGSLDSSFAASQVDRVLVLCADKLSEVDNHHFPVGQLHGSAFLGAYAVRAFRLKVGNSDDVSGSWDAISSILAALGRGSLHSDDVVGNACSDSLAIALSYDVADAPILASQLYKSSAKLLEHLSSAITKFGHSETVNASRASKLTRAAGVCLSSTTTGSGLVDVEGERINLGPARLSCVGAIFNLLGSAAFKKEEEIGIVVGEALGDYSDAFGSATAVWHHPEVDWPPEYEEDFGGQLPPHEHVLYVLLRKFVRAASPQKRTATATALLAVVARGAKWINLDKTSVQRPLVQSLIRHLEEIQQAFVSLLSDPKSKHLSRESCCLGLAACRTLSKIHIKDTENASHELNDRLLRAFGQTTNFGGSALMETQGQAAARRATEQARASNPAGPNELLEPFGMESEVGGASGIGEAALGAYREMAAASMALGEEDVLYSLLVLSVSHSFWSTTEARERYSSQFLLGTSSFLGSETSSARMREALRPHLGKLLPRVLRACHDPNKQTREQMSSLWVGLTGGGAESRQAITQHLLTTVDALVKDASHKFWRARVGSCGALAEIIVGREWNDLGGGGPVLNDDDLHAKSKVSSGVRLLRLWRVATRALDDVRGAVRESGGTLARAVRALTIRLCDPSMPGNSVGTKRGREELSRRDLEASSAAATSLRWLIRHGLNQQCAEATGVCINTLCEVVQVVKPMILEPTLPDLMQSLLLAISGLEPAALNYMQLRTNDHESLERVRLQLAQNGPLATAVTKCLDLLPGMSIETQRRVVPLLDSALRRSAGFASRAATADATATLCGTCPEAFRFSSVSTANPSVRLLRALYYASEREHGAGAKDKMIHALGSLSALCPGSSVRSLAVRACDRYKASTGNNDDPSSRRASAAALRAIAVRASAHFADGGNNDVWINRVLPVAFLGRKDSDSKIASLWSEVWEEGGSVVKISGGISSNAFGTRLEERLLSGLVRESVRGLQDVSWSRRVAAATAIFDLSSQDILSPAPRSTQSSKMADSMARARHRAEASATALHESVRVLMKPRLWTGKAEVVRSAVMVASKWASAETGTDKDAVLGWDGEDATCPWRPIAVSPGQFEDDLFNGDGWFSVEDAEMEGGDGATDAESQMMDVEKNSDGEEEERINFDACDQLLEDDVAQIDDDANVGDAAGVLSFGGLCRLLIDNGLQSSGQSVIASDELLPYRTACLRGFRDLLKSLGDEKIQKKEIYTLVGPRLIGTIAPDGETEDTEAPVLVASAIDCLGACFWDGFGDRGANGADANVLELSTTLQKAGKHPAWTVRESASLCLATLAATCKLDTIRQHGLVSGMVESARHALTDRKFWRVRFAGLKLLRSLTERAGTSSDKQLVLEALLPHKEVILGLTRKSLTDSQAEVTALASEIVGALAWWP